MSESRTIKQVTYYVTATGIPDGHDRDFSAPRPVFIGEDVGMNHRHTSVWVKHFPIQFATMDNARDFIGHGGNGFGFTVDTNTIKIVKRTVVTTTTEEDVGDSDVS